LTGLENDVLRSFGPTFVFLSPKALATECRAIMKALPKDLWTCEETPDKFVMLGIAQSFVSQFAGSKPATAATLRDVCERLPSSQTPMLRHRLEQVLAAIEYVTQARGIDWSSPCTFAVPPS